MDSFGVKEIKYVNGSNLLLPSFHPETKTSAEWNREDGVMILDPDGWDRQNFHFSFYEENITKEEYDNRLMESTCMHKVKGNDEKDT